MPDRPGDDPTWLQTVCSPEPCAGRRKHVLTLAVLLVAVLTGVHGFNASEARLLYPDAFDYAQMARQLAAGEGMTSLQAFPYVVGWLADGGFEAGSPWPNVWRFPLPIVLRAASMRLLGPSEAAALLPALLLSLGTAPLLFRLANRLGGALAGLLAASLWIVSPSQHQFASSGLTEPGAVALAVAIAGLALRARDDSRRFVGVGLGAALGLALLQRSNLLALAPVAVGIAVLGQARGRGRRLASILGTALLVASPWLLRNAVLFGDPLLNLTSDRGLLRLGLGADPFYRLAIEDPASTLRSSLALYPQGWSLEWLAAAAPQMLGREFAWLLPVGLVGAVVSLRGSRAAGTRDRRLAAAWALAWSGLAATAAVFAPPYPDVLRFYWPYTALLLAPGCALLASLAQRLPGKATGPVACAAGIAVFVLAAPRGNVAPLFPAPASPVLGWSGETRTVEGLVASDQSYVVAWQTGLPSLRFSGDYAVLSVIDERIERIGAIYLSAANVRTAAPLRRPPLSRLFEPVEGTGGALFVRTTVASAAALEPAVREARP